MSPYRIMLVDDQEIFRNGARHILEKRQNFQVCGEACDQDEFFNYINNINPELIILEIDLPQGKGAEILRTVKQDHQHIKVLILTSCKKRDLIHFAVNHDADGFILKEEPSSELLRAVEVIQNGGKFFSPLLSGDLMSFISKKKPLKPYLTAREKEILRHLAEGKPNREIAQHLNVNVCTVHRHRYNIMKKLNMKHIPELIKYAIVNRDSLFS